jgi:hypothetical protein
MKRGGCKMKFHDLEEEKDVAYEDIALSGLHQAVAQKRHMFSRPYRG